MPGKTRRVTDGPSLRVARFNEAPAKCRGKPSPELDEPAEKEEASMRPQRNAGENVGISGWRLIRIISFNEAPAKCRGKRHIAHEHSRVQRARGLQ